MKGIRPTGISRFVAGAPDLDEIGGIFQGTVANPGNGSETINVQGALLGAK